LGYKLSWNNGDDRRDFQKVEGQRRRHLAHYSHGLGRQTNLFLSLPHGGLSHSLPFFDFASRKAHFACMRAHVRRPDRQQAMNLAILGVLEKRQQNGGHA
jgi:hypothetical protein